MSNIETKKCSGIHGCGKIKPVSEFYQRTDGTYLTPCRTCKRNYVKSRAAVKSQSPNHEQEFIAECRKRGIVADHGKEYRKFAHVDVVCFGAIRVELKNADYSYKYPSFRFSHSQKMRGLLADVVVLMLPSTVGYQYHFFDPRFQKFYKLNNGQLQLKQAVAYINTPTHEKDCFHSLVEHDMVAARDQWHLLYPLSLRSLLTTTSNTNLKSC